jgi:hypothetical protein
MPSHAGDSRRLKRTMSSHTRMAALRTASVARRGGGSRTTA